VNAAAPLLRPCGAVGRAVARATETLALTLRAEAGELPVRAIEALAALVVNRARLAAADETARLRFSPGATADATAAAAWPLLLGRVCRAPFLFACWNPRDPRHATLGEAPEGDPTLAACRRIARRAASGILPDPTGGATHWHSADTLPGWALGRIPASEIGGLVFYRPGD
jgi:N-acetylmuramoyl-L-alanine amidase